MGHYKSFSKKYFLSGTKLIAKRMKLLCVNFTQLRFGQQNVLRKGTLASKGTESLLQNRGRCGASGIIHPVNGCANFEIHRTNTGNLMRNPQMATSKVKQRGPGGLQRQRDVCAQLKPSEIWNKAEVTL